VRVGTSILDHGFPEQEEHGGDAEIGSDGDGDQKHAGWQVGEDHRVEQPETTRQAGRRQV
jgi:hypothetical protein